mgnify:CR=1 FL=1
MQLHPSTDVLVGGAITAVIAIIGVAAERRWSHELRKKEKLETLSALAFSIQVKIASSHGWLRSSSRAIDECFNDADAGPFENMEPGVKVKPLVGNPRPDISFSPDELALLLRTGDSGLAEKLLSFQWTVGTVGALLDSFNRSRIAFSRFAADSAVEAEFVDGPHAKISMAGRTRHAYEARIAELNTLVGELLTSLPECLDQSKLIMKRVESSFRSIKGLEIRHVELQ